MDERCVNCDTHFDTRDRGYRRHSLSSKVRGGEATCVEVLSESFGVSLSLTPKRSAYLCQSCTAATNTLATSQRKSAEAREQLRTSARDGTYLKRKLQLSSPGATPKRPRVISTPVKRSTLVVEAPKVGLSGYCLHGKRSGNLFIVFLYKKNRFFISKN